MRTSLKPEPGPPPRKRGRWGAPPPPVGTLPTFTSRPYGVRWRPLLRIRSDGPMRPLSAARAADAAMVAPAMASAAMERCMACLLAEERLLAAGDVQRIVAARRKRCLRALLDGLQADQVAVEARLRRLDLAEAVVVEVRRLHPGVDPAQRLDDPGVGVRVLIVALQGQAVPGRDVALAEPLRGDRARDELDRDRVAVAHVGAHVAGDEGVDVAREEDDVRDVVVADVRRQLLALARVALP